MRKLVLLCVILLLGPACLWAQEKDDKVEERIHALEQRVRALEAVVESLRAVQGGVRPVALTVRRPPAGADVDADAAQGTQQTLQGQLPVYGGGSALAKVLNPDISVIGNFVGAAGRNLLRPFPSLSLQESEVSLQAIVDPYARADFFLAVGEEGIELEEGYLTFPALPGGYVAKVGRMRAAFGRVNSLHNHSLPWVDRPLVTFNLMGGSLEEADVGIKDAGLSVSRILPAPRGLFLEATAEVYRGDSGTLFRASRRNDLSFVGRLRAYGDLTESANLEMGGSFARGHNDLGSLFVTKLLGVDATFRWKPLRRAIYRSFALRGEFIWSRREEEAGTRRAFGFFTSAEYRLGRRWFLGGRYDWSERAREPAQHDRGGSLVLTYWPSEFNQVRWQFRRTRYAERETANEVLVQFLFTIGTHGAHPF